MSAPSHKSAPVLEPQLVPVPVPPPQTEKGSRKWLLLLLLLLLICGAIAAWLILRAKTQAPIPAANLAVRTATASSGTLNRVLRVTGQTAAINFANITAPRIVGPESNRELILLQVAKSGSWVKKGQLVAQIDAQSLVDHVDDLTDTIRAARADVDKRRAEQSVEMENLMQTLRTSKAEADKARLEYNGSETQTDIQRQLLKLTLDEADARYKQAQSDIAFKKASQTAELKVLEYTLERHTRHRDRHARDVKAFSVYATMDGLVVMQQIFRGGEFAQVQQGDQLRPGQPFMKIVDTRRMQLEGNVNQAASSEFRVGQKARIKFDAFAGMEFDGTIHSIGALAAGGFRNSYFVRNVPVRINIIGHDPRLIPDLSASADVIVESAANQVIVPIPTVRIENGKTIVYVRNGETFEPREVVTGLRNDTQIAITSGLQAGEVVRIE
jgi:multidrug resistance efflux pump